MFLLRFGHVRPVEADEAQFEQARFGLLRNAHQALQGRGGEVVICTWEESGYAYVTFADNGPGVPEPFCDRIYDAVLHYGHAPEPTGEG